MNYRTQESELRRAGSIAVAVLLVLAIVVVLEEVDLVAQDAADAADPLTNCAPSCERFVTNSSVAPKVL